MQGVVQPVNAKGMVPILLISDSGNCEGCASKGFCQLPKSDHIEVFPGQLPEGCEAGSRVDVELASGFRIWLAFSIFILPLLLMVAGAFLGQGLDGGAKTERWTILCGFAGLLIGGLVGWLLHRGRLSRLRIQITRC